jgi:phosphate:Na+ symporter
MDGINLGALVGGVGLFLLGMTMMTDGLKLAVGPALSKLLHTWTATRLRGLLFGIFATALVQSSSAITVAAIGFVNAGLLPLGQSLWVFFGANVGTTFTGWLVAVIGFKLKLEAAALPLIGIGILLRISGPDTRRGAIGGAIGGFGVLFLGIGFLQQAFVAGGSALDLSLLSGYGIWSIIAFVLAGAALTVLMQASAAALAIILTLAEAGVLPLTEAAAAVIGANIGTTTTALLAAIGATPNAHRAALAHVMFNVLTGVVALLLLPVLLGMIGILREALELGSQPAISLALFHSIFNLLGVILMWPLTDRLAHFLQSRFRTQEEEIGQPHFIDRNVASVPSLAVDALHREISRLGNIVLDAARRRSTPDGEGPAAWPKVNPFPPLSRAILDFVTEVNRHPMQQSTAKNLAALLRVHRYYDTCHELGAELGRIHTTLPTLPDASLIDEARALSQQAVSLLEQVDPAMPDFTLPDAEGLATFELAYYALKARLLEAGAAGTINIDSMDELMSGFSALRRIVEQAHKASVILDTLSPVPAETPVAD